MRPTGKCFDDALDFVWEIARKYGDTREEKLKILDSLIIVHGICLAPDLRPYAHAWVEQDREKVWQAKVVLGVRIFFPTDLAAFYAATLVQDKTEYSWRQSFEENLLTGHFGPWEEKYRELCVHPLDVVCYEAVDRLNSSGKNR